MAEFTPEQWRERLMARPEIMEGPPIHEREFEGGDGDGLGEAYECAAETLAKAMLIVSDEKPELLDITKEKENDPSGWEAASNEKLWQAVKERWPGIDDWLGGTTGFQFGWAHNIVRYTKGVDATGNPAIMTVKSGD